MTDEEFEREKGRVNALIDRWTEPLGLTAWTVRHIFERLPHAEDANLVAETHVRWEYCEASINWFLANTGSYEDRKLEVIFIHEAMHVALNEMRQKSVKHEERVATELSFAIQRVRDRAAEGALS